MRLEIKATTDNGDEFTYKGNTDITLSQIMSVVQKDPVDGTTANILDNLNISSLITNLIGAFAGGKLNIKSLLAGLV